MLETRRTGSAALVEATRVWVETSWGPAELDVADATTYLALLHGPDVAERFLALRPTPRR